MKNFNKKCLLGLMILMMSCLFTSCVDYVQGITFKDGRYTCNYKITMSKSIIDASGTSSDDFFDEMGSAEDMAKELDFYGCDYDIKEIDDDMDIGFEIMLSVKKNQINDTMDFLPTVSKDGSKMAIPFFLGESSDDFEDVLDTEDQESQALMLGFLSSTKCKVLISKTVKPNIKGAYFAGDSVNFDLSVYEFGDTYVVDIPLIVLAMGNDVDLEELIVY